MPAAGGDVYCGSGRWVMVVAPRVAHLYLFDASDDVLAVDNLKGVRTVSFHDRSADDIGLPPKSLNFAFSCGALHHLPDTSVAIKAIMDKLKEGALLFDYLHYTFDDRLLWSTSVSPAQRSRTC